MLMPFEERRETNKKGIEEKGRWGRNGKEGVKEEQARSSILTAQEAGKICIIIEKGFCSFNIARSRHTISPKNLEYCSTVRGESSQKTWAEILNIESSLSLLSTWSQPCVNWQRRAGARWRAGAAAWPEGSKDYETGMEFFEICLRP